MNSYLIDTNILVLAIRQRQNKWELLRGLVVTGATLSCSVITLGEIYAGMRPHERVRTEELLSVLDSHPVTVEVARLAGLLKNEWKVKGFTLTLPDMLIAATAIAHGLTLITDNLKDFPMPELKIYSLP
jgi:predicted nucleic acid-binding protein